jgi:hypothetical protein
MPALDGLHDPRLVLWLDKEQFIGRLGEEWQLGIQGGADMWARADAFILRKKRGEIDSRSSPVTDI